MLTSIILVDYNSAKVTRKMLESIREFKYIKQIIIVDNNSQLENYEELIGYTKGLERSKSKKINVLRSDENLGYFGGLNLGIDFVLKNYEGENVLIANNDLLFEEDFFEILNQEKFNVKDLVIAPRVKTIDGHEQNPHLISKIGKKNILLYDFYYLNYYLGMLILKVKRKFMGRRKVKQVDKGMEIFAGIGAIYILTPYFFDCYRTLECPVFLWGEEIFLAHQIERVNGKIVYNPKLKVKHLESVTTSQMPSKEKYLLTKKSYKIYKKYMTK
ncbi:glycosyltransferase family 2 protein [Gracilibacillus kekensis]|uniref:Glycosyltransferase, GT2 family n=1 Tax=Gracilibacillus kekensis TaxID=1027249 RepID=A0A1M7K2L0_9BACI|nr:glycosyltransferase [Gracilibacillus kekensis]SHM59434.1 Glycosyltransferase, GT2 family [Gracilibacillus kekensis]